MADTWDREQKRKLVLRGLGWCLCLGVWTAALLTYYPTEVGETVLPTDWHYGAAKCLHVSAYIFLTLYLSWLPMARRYRWLLLALLSLHAMCTEFCQQFVPGRHPAVTDVLINHFGMLLGVLLSWKRWLPHQDGSSLSRDPDENAPHAPVRLAVGTKPFLSSPSSPAASVDRST